MIKILAKIALALIFWLDMKSELFRKIHVSAEIGKNKKPGPVFMVSMESDGRYKWLEYAGANVIYIPYRLFQTPALYYKNCYKLRLYLWRILKTIRNEYHPAAFISASLGDLRWNETIKAARRLGIPWVITEREGIIAPVVFKNNVAYVKNHFSPEADLLCAANETHQRYWKAIGIHNVVITGDLKTDYWHNNSRWPKRKDINPVLDGKKTMVLYFAFGRNNYINERLYPNNKADWLYLQYEHYDVLKEIAAAYEDKLQLVVKGGHPSDLQSWFKHEVVTSQNIVILDSRYQAIDLIVNADIIIGFQTTALIEAMFTAKPIIYAAWGKLYSEIKDDLIPLHRTQAVRWAQSKTEMRESLLYYIDNPMESRESARKEFRERYYYKPDGDTGRRTYQAIKEYLNASNKAITKIT